LTTIPISHIHNHYQPSLIAELIKGSDQLSHLDSLPGWRFLLIWRHFILGLETVQMDDFIFQQFVQQQSDDLLEMNHITADQSVRHLAEKFIVPAGLMFILYCLADLLLSLESVDFQVEQVELFASISSHLQHCVRAF
jgi:hypothetical protein